jgi:hydroxysqualene dehydroxylase
LVNVAVIGGGCAGLAAAAKLAEHNIPVTLFEASPQLGGRARGVKWQGHMLDNGQHILLGAYSETLSLLKLAGVDLEQALLRLPLQLTMRPNFELRACQCLPAPLHILAGLFNARDLGWNDRLSAIGFMAWMKLIGFKLKQDISLAELLNTKNQSSGLIKLLWEPLCLAALNTPLHLASSQVFLNVLRDSFSKSKTDSDMLLPKQDLSQLMAEPLAQYIQSHGGEIHCGHAVEAITANNAGFAISSADGMKQQYSHVVLAVSPSRVSSLSRQLPALSHAEKLVNALHYQPICTIYLQYPEDLRLQQPMIGLAEGLGQWVFDRGQLYGQHGLLAVVISAEGTHQQLTQDALAERIVSELCDYFPVLSHPLKVPLWHKIITEKRATFACQVAMQRPDMRTADARLFLAGDYVAGDYPATIEGAVRSGSSAAKAIIQSIP